MSPKSNEILELELENAENDLRKSAKSLYKNIELSYWELGKVLYEVFDGIPGGYRQLIKGELARRQRTALFSKWGYSSFEEWCEREVGILRRSASSLRQAYWWFEIELNLSDKIKDRLKSIGRSKIYLLAAFATAETVESWLDKAESMTYEELKKAVQAVKAINKKPSGKDKEMFEHAAQAEASEYNSAADGYTIPPGPEHTHTVTTTLYDGQFGTFEAAIDRAKNVTGSDKLSHNLEMICLDFLATNDFTKPNEDKKKQIAKMEKMLGVKLIAIDPSSGKPIYGADLLWGMVKQRLEFEKEEQAGKDTENAKPSLRIVENDDEPPAAF